MPRRRRRVPRGQVVPKRVPEYSWEGDTGHLLRRLSGPTQVEHTECRPCLWFGLGLVATLAAAALLASVGSVPADLHLVTTSQDRIIWVSHRTGRVGGCVFEEERVRCVKTD